MKLEESSQELLEELWIAAEETAAPGVALGSELPAGIEPLLAQGLAERTDGHLRLTPRGRPEAALAVRRHRLAERLLADVLTTDAARLDQDACRLEHALLEGIDDSICTLLGHPQVCPHGRPIPAGECCRQMRNSVGRLIAPLRDLEPDQGGRIAYVQMNHPGRLQKLMAMGVLPGVNIRMVRRFPSFVFEAGLSQFAVDDEIAADIYVRLSQTPRPHA